MGYTGQNHREGRSVIAKLSTICATGIFIATVGASLLLYKSRQSKRFKSGHNTKLTLLINEIQFKKNRAIQKLKSNKKLLIIRLITALLFAAGSGRNLKELFQYFVIGYILAIAVSFLVIKTRKGVIKNQKMKNIAILFEAVELYMKGGYSLYQSLMLSRSLVPKLKKEINICLDYWSISSRKALEKFKEALNIEEGEILVSLLIHMEMAGTKDLHGMLSREAFNVERLRRLKNEMSISLRPIYLMVYRFLPLASAIGIITGPLLYRTFVVLRDSSIIGF